MIPYTYQDWRHCIQETCKIKLEPNFIRERLLELNDQKHPKTLEFTRHYGEEHTKLVISWFEKALLEVKQDPSSKY
jgi:hypothetical protein